MTIIVYRKPYLVSDGRVTIDNEILTNKSQKIYRLKNGSLFGLAGDADCSEVVALFDKQRNGKFPALGKIADLHLDFRGILVQPDGKAWTVEAGSSRTVEDGSKIDHSWYAMILEVKEQFVAVGSGSKWAVGALDRGASAEQAVKVAVKYDSNCGGVAQKYSIESKE